MSMGNGDIDSRLSKLEEQVKALDRLYQKQLDSMADATQLQAAEYARRLDELNHERKRDSERQAHYISNESCRLTHSEIGVWRELVTKQLARMEGVADGKARAYAIIAGVVAIAVSVVLKLVK